MNTPLSDALGDGEPWQSVFGDADSDDPSSVRRYAPVGVVCLSAVAAVGQFLAFPVTQSSSPINVLGEGAVVLVLAAALFVVSRIDESSIYRPLMGGAAVFYVFALADFLDEFSDQPRWFSLVFENSAQAAGAVLLVVGLARLTAARRERTAELRRRNERLAVLNRVLQHDVRNDALVIRGWASVVRKERGPDADDRLDRIVSASNGIIELTESTASFTDALTTAATADLEPRPLAETVEAELEKVRARHDEAVLGVDGSLPDVDVLAHSMLSAVFRDLLTNAVEHSDAPTPRVRISAERRNGTAAVRIADNGPGIPADQRDRLLESEVTAASDPESRFGLPLVGALVEQFDGEISVEDADDGGTAVTVVLQTAESDGDRAGGADRSVSEDASDGAQSAATGRAREADSPPGSSRDPDDGPALDRADATNLSSDAHTDTA